MERPDKSRLRTKTLFNKPFGSLMAKKKPEQKKKIFDVFCVILNSTRIDFLIYYKDKLGSSGSMVMALGY